jgi:hypothetical protein
MLGFIEGSLPENELQSFREHLEECADCKAFSVYLRSHLQIIDSEKLLEPAPFLYTRIQGRMGSALKPEMGKTWIPGLQPVLFSFLLLAAIISGLKLGQVLSGSPENNYITESLAPLVNEIESEPLELFLMSD